LNLLPYLDITCFSLKIEKYNATYKFSIMRGGEFILAMGVDPAYPFVVGDNLSDCLIYCRDKYICSISFLIKSISKIDNHSIFLSLTTENSDELSKLWREIGFLQKVAPVQTMESNEKIPGRGLYTEEAKQKRLQFLREKTGKSLEYIEKTSLTHQRLKNNIESFIGTVEIPVGIAGPLLIRGQGANGLIYAPFATTEGALVASATRGAKAVSISGGVVTRVLGQRMVRVPVFEFSSISDAILAAHWIDMNFSSIRQQVSLASSHADLVKLDTHFLGRYLHICFVYHTADAAGQNMTTTCTAKACEWILQQFASICSVDPISFIIDGNLSSDKKASSQNLILGRGTRVIAECNLTEDALREVLNVSSEQFMHAYQIMVASNITMGAIGMNIKVSNVVAAIFSATGQDIASIHEASLGQLYAERGHQGQGLYMSMTLSSLTIGTIGGGTSLPTQQECLDILDCNGTGKLHRLAEIICGYCLALDLSTISAAAAGEFARAHELMGRNKPDRARNRVFAESQVVSDLLS